MRFKRPRKKQRPAAIQVLEQRRLLSIQPVGPESLVNTYTTLDQRAPAVAMDAHGNFVITWDSYSQDGSGLGVYAQRYNAAGAPQGPEFRVNTHTTGAQVFPSVAMDADGNLVIAWSSRDQDGSGYGVYAQRYNASGVPQGAEFRVNTFTPNSQGSASVAMDVDGDFVVAWESFGQDGGFDYAVYARRYNASGVSQGPEFRVNTYTTSNQRYPSAAMDADGNFVIGWISAGQDGSGSGVYAQRYNVAGVPQGAEFPVNTYTTNTQFDPSVAMEADGDFVIAWYSLGQDGSGSGVYAQRYNAVGVPQGAEFPVNTYTTERQQRPRVAMEADGDFVITWHSFGQDGSAFGVYAQRYNPAGVPQGPEFRVNTYTTFDQRAPAVAMDANGDFVIAWESYSQDGSRSGVYARRYELIPSVMASTFLFATAPHGVQFAFDENVSASLGIDDLIVQNLTTMQTIPSSDFSLSYDSLSNTGTFNYTGSEGGIAGVLPDGNYRATLLAAGVTTPNGNPLPEDHILDFFFLQADANHDARVNLQDFNILAANFGQSPRDFTQGDFNYDTIVNLADFDILAARFGHILAAPDWQSIFSNADSKDRDAALDDLLA